MGGFERLLKRCGAIRRSSGDEKGSTPESSSGRRDLAEGSLAEEDACGGSEFKRLHREFGRLAGSRARRGAEGLHSQGYNGVLF